jgi:hypothetical protein
VAPFGQNTGIFIWGEKGLSKTAICPYLNSVPPDTGILQKYREANDSTAMLSIALMYLSCSQNK